MAQNTKFASFRIKSAVLLTFCCPAFLFLLSFEPPIALPRGIGRVEGGYHASPLSVKSERAGFPALGFRISLVFPTFAHVNVVVTTSMDGKKVLLIPVIVISIDMM